MKTLEVEYIESGTFQGGEEDVSKSGIKFGQSCIVMDFDQFQNIKMALTKIANFEEESIWADDRDDAARCIVDIAEKALRGKYEYES